MCSNIQRIVDFNDEKGKEYENCFYWWLNLFLFLHTYLDDDSCDVPKLQHTDHLNKFGYNLALCDSVNNIIITRILCIILVTQVFILPQSVNLCSTRIFTITWSVPSGNEWCNTWYASQYFIDLQCSQCCVHDAATFLNSCIMYQIHEKKNCIILNYSTCNLYWKMTCCTYWYNSINLFTLSETEGK